MTQAEQLVILLRRRWMTYGDLQATRVSTCPWKRLSESASAFLRPGEQIMRKVGKDGLLRMRVARPKK